MRISEVETVLAHIDDQLIVKDCCRVGTSKTNLIRPEKFSLNSHSHVAQVLKSARKLRTVVGKNPNRSTFAQTDLLKKKNDNNNDNYSIKFEKF